MSLRLSSFAPSARPVLRAESSIPHRRRRLAEVVLAVALGVAFLVALLGLLARPAGAVGLPSTPARVVARPLSTTQIQVSWVRTDTGDVRFVVEERIGDVWTPVRTTKKNLKKTILAGLAPGSLHHYRVASKNAAGQSAWSEVTGAITDRVAPPSTCSPPAGHLCLLDDRFRVIAYAKFPDSVKEGGGEPVREDTAVVWLFAPTALEAMVRVVDACLLNSRYWLFSAGWGTAEFAIDVTDTHTGYTRSIYNPVGQSLQGWGDVGAFPSCD